MNKFTWSILRTLLFIVIGLMNTLFIKQEDLGSWKNYAGYLFLIIAAIDGFIILKKFLSETNTKEKDSSS